MENIKDLLAKGFTMEEITAMFNAELAQEDEVKVQADKAKETKVKVNETLNDARAHLITAFGLYNEVFDFCEFTDEGAAKLADALAECEDWILENREAFDVYLSLADAATKNPRDSHLGSGVSFGSIRRMLGL